MRNVSRRTFGKIRGGVMRSKQVLSIDQMKHLQELGVDTSDASMVLLFKTEDGEYVGWDEVQDNGKDCHFYQWYNPETEIWESTTIELLNAETGNYDHSYRGGYGVFTLQDIIDKLPKRIGKFELRIKMFAFDYVGHTEYKWSIIYESTDMMSYLDTLLQSSYTNLIEAAYNMLCMCIETDIL